MSLDVSLTGENRTERCCCPRCGNEHEATEREIFFEANITHNLNAMAGEAGIYQHLWRPEEIGITKAKQLIEPLRTGLQLMRSDPTRFLAFNASNGWGTYDQFLPWIQQYLDACEEYPEANVSASR